MPGEEELDIGQNAESEHFRAEHQERWEDTADALNKARPGFKKTLGLGKVTAEGVMRDEAAADDKAMTELMQEQPRNRPGSPYVEIDLSDPDIARKIQEFRDKLQGELTTMKSIELRREAKGENRYRAPELNPFLRTTSQEFALQMLNILQRDGKLNFWDMSVDLKKKDPTTPTFDRTTIIAFGTAAEWISQELGIEEKKVPESGAETPEAKVAQSPELSHEQAETPKAGYTLEYDVEDLKGGSLGSRSQLLPENLEEAQDTALKSVIDAEMNPATANQLVRNAKVKMPDGTVVPWQEFTDPANQRAREKTEAA
ncbi:MAG TPA: hypothetical protein VEH48_01835 [Candidatus Nitrosopolaris sp.]|nr:hypothetical protein [Candidatus Nitrosopolaris sp.]